MNRAEIALARPRLGFIGVGWIGRDRLESVVARGGAQVVALADTDKTAAEHALAVAPDARVVASLDELLDEGVDGVVIATPSALHAAQAIRALEAGAAVFCQKPLARTGAETRAIVDAARAADRLLGIDFCYRYVRGVPEIRELVRAGGLGRVYALDLVFHNAYGPGRPWFRDPHLSGGGCLIDLGVHLVDLALWLLDGAAVERAAGRLYAAGQALGDPLDVVEDYATAELHLAGNVAVRMACSWNLHAGQDAVIEVRVHGTDGGAALRNVNGSFYDFVAEKYHGTSRSILAEPPDVWGGRAIVEWTERLAGGERFDPACEGAEDVANVLDRVYGR